MRMFPPVLPEEVRDHPLLSGEREVYRRLRDQFDNAWVGFYSRPWLGMDENGTERDGEVDFIIAHPKHGILVIEVKGGRRIRTDEPGIWYTTNHLGHEWKIKNPIKQAVSGKHTLLDKLKYIPFLSNRFILISHGVIFPQASRPDRPIGLDGPVRIFAGIAEMPALEPWVLARLAAAREGVESRLTKGEGLGSRGIDLLISMLAPRLSVVVKYRDELGQLKEKIGALTVEQGSLMAQLMRNRRLLIEGAAGTGKTVLAFQEAKSLASTGSRVLFICKSPSLSAHLSKDGPIPDSLTIENFRSFVGVCINSDADFEDVPDDDLSERLLSHVENFEEPRFDTIIIDEGQDFTKNMIDAVELCLDPSVENRFFIFFDPNQNVYTDSANTIRALHIECYPLSRNIRNTRPVADIVSNLYSGTPFISIGPDGEGPLFVQASSEKIVGQVSKLVTNYIADGGVDPRDIVVLVVDRDAKRNILSGLSSAPFRTRDSADEGGSAVLVEAIDEFKGLEADIVILVGNDDLIDDAEKLYVGVSRPRAHLVLVGSSDLTEFVQSKCVPPRSN